MKLPHSDLSGGMMYKQLNRYDLCKCWTFIWGHDLQLHGCKLNTCSTVWHYSIQLWKRNDFKSQDFKWFPFFCESASFQGFFLIIVLEFLCTSVIPGLLIRDLNFKYSHIVPNLTIFPLTQIWKILMKIWKADY